MYSIAADATFEALLKDGPACDVRRVASPLPKDDEVVVRIAWAGVCRTDLYAAEGRLRTSERVVLGHEASGVVVAVGPRVGWGDSFVDEASRAIPSQARASSTRDASRGSFVGEACRAISLQAITVGDHVTIIPRVRCSACPSCVAGGGPLECDAPQRLGIDRDGVFAEYTCVPASSIAIVPRTLPLRLAAYVEPVAAALAVLSLDYRSGERGLIYGKNRIAELTRRVLLAHDKTLDVAVLSEPEARACDPGSFDFAIETTATMTTLSSLLRAVRRSGRIVLKSRPFEPVPLDVSAAVEKEITIHAVRYAPFADAIAWLDERRLVVEDLLGQDYALARFEDAFAAAREESTKPFFKLGAA